eukprot:SAG31_NODE_37260_length_306_cov_0.333333_1_plen_61_part_01
MAGNADKLLVDCTLPEPMAVGRAWCYSGEPQSLLLQVPHPYSSAVVSHRYHVALVGALAGN